MKAFETLGVHVHVHCTCTMFMYIVHVQCSCTLYMYNVHVHVHVQCSCTCTCTMFMYMYMYMYIVHCTCTLYMHVSDCKQDVIPMSYLLCFVESHSFFLSFFSNPPSTYTCTCTIMYLTEYFYQIVLVLFPPCSAITGAAQCVWGLSGQS